MNYKIKIATTGLLVFLLTSSAFADITDTIYTIEEIQVKANRLEQYLIGSSVQQIDSQTLNNYQSQSLAELLSHQSLVSVKTYGPGGVAGISIRGGGSHHASVIWNGINIQSPMNGEVNFSTLPVSFIDKAYIQFGGATTLFGSGTATGSIHMSDVLHLNSGFQADISGYMGINHPYSGLQSFGISNCLQSGKISYGSKRWASSLKFFYQDNKNDFEYQKTTNGPYEKLVHGSYNQYGIAQSNKIILGEKSVIGSDIWLLNFYKEVPSLMSSYDTGQSNQTDRNLMYSVYYKYLGPDVQIKLQSGGFYNQVLYENPLLEPPVTNNRSFSSINVVELNSEIFQNFQLGLIFEYKNERALTGFYSEWKTRNIISPVLSVLYENNKLAAVASIRKEFVDGSFIPLVFSTGLDLNIIPGVNLKAQLSKNYSLPTFNNLYWEFDGWSVGNPDLLPETGWSGEAGLHYSLTRDKIQFNSSAVFFQNNISNWMKWFPDSNKVWTPVNVQEGISKGMELDASVNSEFNKLQVSLKARYGYTNAIATESGEADIQTGKQMLYVPKHQAYVGANIAYKIYLVEYTHNFVGERTYDNYVGVLRPYTIGNLTLQASIPAKQKIQLVIFSKINNLWNTEYQMKNSYATPLRQYIFGIKFLFNQ